MLQDVAPCTSTTTEFMCVSEECCFACVRRRLRALMPVHPEENDHTPSAIHLDSHASRVPCASQVPRVYDEFSKARVLTMSFEEGCNVTDVAAILGMGLKVQDVARRLTEAFNKQIFEAGFGIVCSYSYSTFHVSLTSKLSARHAMLGSSLRSASGKCSSAALVGVVWVQEQAAVGFARPRPVPQPRCRIYSRVLLTLEGMHVLIFQLRSTHA